MKLICTASTSRKLLLIPSNQSRLLRRAKIRLFISLLERVCTPKDGLPRSSPRSKNSWSSEWRILIVRTKIFTHPLGTNLLRSWTPTTRASLSYNWAALNGESPVWELTKSKGDSRRMARVVSSCERTGRCYDTRYAQCSPLFAGCPHILCSFL